LPNTTKNIVSQQYSIEPAYLSDEQLDYELRIRKLKPRDDRDSKVKVLTRALSGRQIKQIVDPKFKPDTEEAIIEKTLEDITTAIVALVDPENTHEIRKIKSQLAYIIDRILRFPESTATSKPVDEIKSTSFATCLELESDLLDKINLINANRSQILNSTMINEPSKSFLSSRTSKPVPVYKWGLSFNGKTNLPAFLEKANDLMVARGLTEEELFRSAYDLFEEPALTWYRAVRDGIGDWQSLVKLLKKNFLPPDYDERLLDEIKSRYQTRDESPAIYVALMNNMFTRLSKTPPEIDRLKIIRRNLCPHYISALALENITSTDRLIELCQKIDDAYEAKKRIPSAVKNRNPQLHVSEITATSGSKTDKNNAKISNLVCWNCDTSGHVYSQCSAKRKIFCFRCGKKGKTTNSCDACSKNVNQQ
jgi:hypothetical protein